jgi:hypothetical protein
LFGLTTLLIIEFRFDCVDTRVLETNLPVTDASVPRRPDQYF